jgi:hypothetical protein
MNEVSLALLAMGVGNRADPQSAKADFPPGCPQL